MANVDYDFAWATKARYDILHPSIVARTRALLVDAAAIYGATILGTARVQDDFIHVRVRADDSVPINSLKKTLKGQLSFALSEENADIKEDYFGKHVFDRDTFVDTGNPGNGVIDAFINEKPDNTRP